MDNKIFKIMIGILAADILIVICAAIMTVIQTKKPLQVATTSYETITYDFAEATTEVVSTEITTEAQKSEDFTIDMNFVGDLLLATNQGQYYPGCFREVADREAPEYFLENVRDRFLNDDLTVGDCENVFSDSTNLTMKDKGQAQAEADYAAACADAAAKGLPAPTNTFQAFWFKSPAKDAKILSAGGVDVVSIDNNHIGDYGKQGKEDTKKALEEAGVEWSDITQTVYKDINGFKIAIICGSMYSGSEVNGMLSNLNAAKADSDYQIVYFHGGQEAVHEAEAWKVEACHKLVDNGADLVIGDHPHRIQRLEEYNGVCIVYSLGNFCFGGHKGPENRTIIFNQKLNITKNLADNSFTLNDSTYEIIPCYVYTDTMNNWKPGIIEDETEKEKVMEFMKGNTSTPL